MLYLLLSPGGNFKFLFIFRGADKMYHGIAFFLWSLSFRLSIPPKFKISPSWIIFIFGSSLAISTELLQYHIPRRTPEFLDAVFDIIGCLLGIFVGRLIKKDHQR